MLPRVFQAPFLELKEYPRGIPVEIVTPRIIPAESDLENGRIARDIHDTRLALHPDVVSERGGKTGKSGTENKEQK